MGMSCPDPARRRLVHAPVATTTTSASIRSEAVSTPTTRPCGHGETLHLDVLAHVGTLRPGAGGERVDDRRRVDLGVVAAEAGSEDVGTDRPDQLADLGPVDQLHVEAVGPAPLDELLEDPSLLRRVEVDHPAVGAELERHGQVGGELVVEPPAGQRDVERPTGVAAVQPDEAGIAAGRTETDPLLLEQRDRQPLAGGEVGGRRADQAAADDDHAASHDRAAGASVAIASWSVRRASTSAAWARSWSSWRW